MDNFSNGNRNAFDGLIMPKANSTDTVEFNTSQILTHKLTTITEYHALASESILKHHEIFNTIYSASEKIRVRQKLNFTKQVEEVNEIHRQQLIDIVQRTYVKPLTIEFIPEDGQVNEDIEEYILKALELNKPLIEILPPTLLADLYSSSGDTSSDNASCSDGVSSRSGYVSSTSSQGA